MSFDPFAHSRDLAALAADGYELEITAAGHLVVKQIPYRTPDGQLARGALVTKLELNGDVTVNPVQDHTVRFIGAVPSGASGEPIRAVINSETAELETGLTVNHHLSSKPDLPYPDYHHKVTAYIGLISAEAQAIDPQADARTHGPCVVDSDSWPFEYVDTAAGRAGIGAISGRLADQRIAIVGLGGTGAYLLDMVAKCPVAAIHLFDGDTFSTHNAFRSPGAATLDELRASQPKVEYLRDKYLNMKRNVVAHLYDIDDGTVQELESMTFVFLAMEGGESKRAIVAALEAMGSSFVDCSIGVVKSAGAPVLLASLEVNGSTPANRAGVHEHVDFGPLGDDDVYTDNIQVAELNALNASLAVIWWKKHLGVYYAPTLYHHQRINISYGRMINE